eukprot:scaffold1142_cov387-Prasinococcus_capsulatus_cf.AAC.8
MAGSARTHRWHGDRGPRATRPLLQVLPRSGARPAICAGSSLLRQLRSAPAAARHRPHRRRTCQPVQGLSSRGDRPPHPSVPLSGGGSLCCCRCVRRAAVAPSPPRREPDRRGAMMTRDPWIRVIDPEFDDTDLCWVYIRRPRGHPLIERSGLVLVSFQYREQNAASSSDPIALQQHHSFSTCTCRVPTTAEA